MPKHLTTVDETNFVLESQVGTASGVAPLGSDGKVPATFLPGGSVAVSSVNSMTGDVVLVASSVGAVAASAVGNPDGVAPLDSSGKLPVAKLPSVVVQSVNGVSGPSVTLTATDLGAISLATADGRYAKQDSLVYNVMDHGATRNGTADDATVINNLLTSSPAGSTVFLPPGDYGIASPIVIPPGKRLAGDRSNLMQVTGLYDPQVRLKVLPSFSGVAAILLRDQATGGYSAISGEQRITNIMVDGSAGPAGVDGLQAKGNIQNVVMEGVTIKRMTGNGIFTGSNAGAYPYSWRMFRVMLDTNGGHGMSVQLMTDLTMIDCQAIGNSANGFVLNNIPNSQLTTCRAEWNGNHGYYITGSWGSGTGSGGMQMSGCGTDRNGFNGVYIDSTGNAPIAISNLMTRRDGRNGGTGGGGYAGLATNAATMPVNITNWINFPGVDDNGSGTNSPQYGASFTGSTHIQVESAYLHGNTAGLNNGGGNTTLKLGTNITYATGTTAAPTRTVQQNYLPLDGTTQVAAAQVPDLSATYLTVAQRGAASGVASLDGSTKVPSAQIPDLSATYLTVAQRNAANGVAGLDASSKITGSQQTYSTSAASIGSANAAGSANTASRGDHVHAGVTSVNGSQGAVTVTAAGIGAVATSAVGAASGVASLGTDTKVPLAQLRNPFFNVQDYGAKGDGSTIDTTTMQAAFDAAHTAGGGTIIIPPTANFYAVDNFLVVYENCTIWAYGATIKSVSTGTGLLRNFLGTDLFNTYAGRSNIKLFGGTWDGNASDGSTGTVTAETDVINFVHCTNILVQDVIVQNVSSAHALEFNSTDGGRAVNCRFLGYRDNSGTSARQFSEAVQIDISKSGSSSIGNFDNTPSKNIVVQGCYFGSSSRLGSFGRAVGSHTLVASTTYDNIQVINNRIEGTIQDGIYAYGWKRSVISGNIITGAGFSGIKITMPDPATTATSPHTIEVSGNTIEAAVADSGIRALGFSTYKIPGVDISDNIIKGITSGNGIHAENCAAPNIDGNTLDTTSSTGIYCNFSDSSSVTGNTVRNAGSNGINIAGSVYANVTGNLVDTTSSNFGIFVGQGSDAATNSTNATVVGNTIIAPSSAGIRLSTNATGCTVSGNTVRKGAGSPSNALSMAASATGCSVLNNDFSGNNWSAATAMSTSTALPFTGPGGMQALPGSNLVDLDFNPLPTLEAYMRPSGRYETTSRLRLGTTSTPTSGTLYLVPIWLPAGLVVSNITFVSGGTAAVSPTNWWFTLHNASKVAVARTADQTTTAWAANTIMTKAIAQTTAGSATSYTTLNNGLHYLGIMIKATTVCNLVSEGSVADVVASVSPGFGGTDTGLSTPPTVTSGAFTAGAFGAGSGILVYGYVS